MWYYIQNKAPKLIAFFYLAEPFIDLKLKFSGNFTEATSNMQAAMAQVVMWLAAKMKISEDRIAGLQLSPGKCLASLKPLFIVHISSLMHMCSRMRIT